MGIYLNPKNNDFWISRNSSIYVDKSLLIKYTNTIINTNNRYICVSRPRRFGKSTDARMLAAYYDHSCNSSSLFDDLKICSEDYYHQYLNQGNVILINMQEFLSNSKTIENMIEILKEELLLEIMAEIKIFDHNYTLRKFKPLNHALYYLTEVSKRPLILIIDEWDCIFRGYPNDTVSQSKYLDYLRDLLKDQSYISMAYITGILPIKKYGSHSALNMFDEISMLNSIPLTKFMGFTEKEVKALCEHHSMNFKDMKSWYDGYHLDNNISLYSPRSVIAAISKRKYDNYWTSTETYESLKIYIDMNFDGLKDKIVKLLMNEQVYIDTGAFENDMTTFKSKDDVLTLLVHLGYLGYDNINKKVYIPNFEVTDSFIQSIKNSNWKNITTALKNSQELLEATWNLNNNKVANYIEQAHFETSILQYNDENALSYTLSLAYYTARNFYTINREMPSGKGYADLIFIPIGDKPAMIVELKYNQSVNTAIKQIKDRQYYNGLEKYLNNLLLVGINYDQKTKKHQCIIEKYK